MQNAYSFLLSSRRCRDRHWPQGAAAQQQSPGRADAAHAALAGGAVRRRPGHQDCRCSRGGAALPRPKHAGRAAGAPGAAAGAGQAAAGGRQEERRAVHQPAHGVLRAVAPAVCPRAAGAGGPMARGAGTAQQQPSLPRTSCTPHGCCVSSPPTLPFLHLPAWPVPPCRTRWAPSPWSF